MDAADPAGAELPTFDDVRRAAARLAGRANRTPVMTSRTLDDRCGRRVVMKCESLQRAGAFKFRGAMNALLALSPEERGRGVLTYSSGNHAGALALAGRLTGVPITVVMPADAPRAKLEATRGYGAAVVEYDPERATREELGARIAAERGLTVVPPYDHADVIAGQGTAALELFEEVGALDAILVPCGGGGLLAGTSLVARALAPDCRVIGVEPAGADDAARSFASGTLHRADRPRTIADGLRTPSLGRLNFALVMGGVDEFRIVDDRAILQALRFLWTRAKLVVEPSGAVGLAPLLGDRVPGEPNARVGVLITGGNVDLAAICGLLTEP